MTRRARFDGNGTVRVMWPPGEVNPEYEEIVETGHLLSTEAPAALRDSLLKNDDWSEVQDSSGPRKPDEKDKED